MSPCIYRFRHKIICLWLAALYLGTQPILAEAEERYQFTNAVFDPSCQSHHALRISKAKSKNGRYFQTLSYPGGSASVKTTIENGKVETKIVGSDILRVSTQTNPVSEKDNISARVTVTVRHVGGVCKYFYALTKVTVQAPIVSKNSLGAEK